MKKLLIILFMSIFLISLVSCTWYDSDFTKKKQINITGGDSILSNFTVFIKIDKETSMQNDYDDLRFVDSSETNELDCDLDYYNSTNAYVWCRVDSLTTDTNVFYMYYGNSDATSQWTINAWDDNVKLLYYFNEGDGSTSADRFGQVNLSLTSTSWVSEVFGVGVNMSDNTASKIYNSTSIVSGSLPTGSSARTIEIFTRHKSGSMTSEYEQYWWFGPAGTTSGTHDSMRLSQGTQYTRDFYAAQSNRNLPNALNNGQYHHTSVTLSGSTDTQYLNGTSTGSRSYTPNTKISCGISILGRLECGQWSASGIYEGTVDMFIYTNVSRNSDWLERSAENMDYNMFVFGSEEFLSSECWFEDSGKILIPPSCKFEINSFFGVL